MTTPASFIRLWKFTRQTWQRIGFLFSGPWLAAIVVALIALRLLCIHLSLPKHLDEFTAAYGADSLFYGTPQVSHDGSRFTFVKTSAVGYSLFLYNTATPQSRELCGEKGKTKQYDTPDINALPWAPDDSSFLYTLSNNLVVCSASTIEPSAEMPIETDSITELAWLNPTEFAYTTYHTNLWRAQKVTDGHWQQLQILSRPDPLSGLTVIGGNIVAFLEGNIICRVDVTSGAPLSNSLALPRVTTVKSTEPPKDGLTLWLDASTLKQSDQSRVTHLPDLSPRKNDAAENGNPPVFNGPDSPLGLSGKGTIHFSSGESVTNVVNATGLATRAAPGISGTAPRSIFVVMRHNTPRTSMMVNMGDARAKGSLFAIEVKDDTLYLPTGAQGADNRFKTASTNWNLLEVIYDGATQGGYVGGVLRHTSRINLSTSDKAVEIGLRTADPSGKNAKGADGDFAELLIYNRALGEEERQQVEQYLSTKWFGHDVRHAPSNPFEWVDPKTPGLTAFSYSKETGTFLLQSTGATESFLSRFDPNTAESVKIAQAEIFASPQWIGGADSAYFRRDAKGSRIVLADSSGKEKSRLLEHSNIRWFGMMPGGQKLFALGTISNEPSAGIWEFDAATRNTSALVPYSDYPSVYAKNIEPIYKTIKNDEGTSLVCAIFRPPNFNPHKKYPLVIGNTQFTITVNGAHGRQWVPCVAAGGAYVVIVERHGGWLSGIDKWSEDIQAACKALKPELNIDTSQMFLFGSSAETANMNPILNDSPGLWKGIILLNPGALPNISDGGLFGHPPKILITAGADEGREANFKAYQQNSMMSGVIVEYVLHSGEAHHIVNNAAQLERTRAIMDFIFK